MDRMIDSSIMSSITNLVPPNKTSNTIHPDNIEPDEGLRASVVNKYDK